MKNNELILSVEFMQDGTEMSFLLNKDITLKALIEALFYGLKNNDEVHFKLFQEYILTHKELVVLYRAKEELELIDVSENLNQKLYELGIVTTSCIQIPCSGSADKVTLSSLFPKYNLPAICDSEKMEYNISTRRITVAEDSVIDILPPDEFPREQKRSYFDVIIPTAISMLALGLSRGLMALFRDNASGFSMIAMMMTTSISTMVTQSYNFVKQGKDNEKSAQEWKENYEKYLTRIWNRILEWQKSDINYLCTTYPSIKSLFTQTKSLNRAIFARSQNDFDFFKIRLGTSEKVEPMFEIKNEQKEEIFSDIGYVIQKDKPEQRVRIIVPEKKSKKSDSSPEKIEHYLTDLPYDLANKYFRYLQAEENADLPPLMLDLKKCGALGIVEKNDEHLTYSHQLVKHIIFELAYYHTPEDLQFVFFFEEEADEQARMKRIKDYKNLPHVNELFEDASQFVFDKESAGIVFGKLQSILGERTKESENDDDEKNTQEKYTQIICVIFSDYDIKETGFSKYLPEPPEEGEEYVNTNGLTFIFARKNLALLPRYCGNIIEITDDTNKKAKLSSRYNILSRQTLNNLSTSGSSETETDDIESLIDYKEFNNDYIFYDVSKDNGKKTKTQYEEAFRRLSAIYYRRIAENGNVPSMVTLFELYGYTSEMVNTTNAIKNKILKNWETNDVTKDLCVPMGKNEHGIVSLDLYEKADGPHMLVAGTTGSGKSETIITYLIGLCMKFSPTYLNLMLVDMKGGGFSDRLRDLPHCVGVVDDTAGESEGISAVYMLKRFLEVLNAEIKRRKILLKNFGIDTVDAYIRAERTISKILNENIEDKLFDLLYEFNGNKISSKDEFKQKCIENSVNCEAVSEATLDLFYSLNPAQREQLHKLKKENRKPKTLSHLVLVVDEFTELKRFSSESDDIDFISEITTIARVGRTLGFHIILVSQNIEGAITEDIRINSKSRICLKVATRAASKEMLDGRTDAASPTMPGNGRAYLLVGTGSKFLYFQSAYTGANKDQNIEPVVTMSQIMPCGMHNNQFYISTKHNERIKQASKNVSEHDTQLSYIVQLITQVKKSNGNEKIYRIPREIFKKPLESKYIDPTNWRKPE